MKFMWYQWYVHSAYCCHKTAPSLDTSYTCQIQHRQHAGLCTHRSCKAEPCCPSALSGGRRRAWTHQRRIRLLLLGQSQVCTAPRDIKGPCQCVLAKMRGGTSTTQQSVISRGHGTPSGQHNVMLASREVTQHWQNTRIQELSQQTKVHRTNKKSDRQVAIRSAKTAQKLLQSKRLHVYSAYVWLDML